MGPIITTAGIDTQDGYRCDCGEPVTKLLYGTNLYVHTNGDACEHCHGDIWLDIAGQWRHLGNDAFHCFDDDGAPTAEPNHNADAIPVEDGDDDHPFAYTIGQLREAIRPLIAVRDDLEGAEEGTTTHEAWLALERAFDEIDSALRTLEDDEERATCKHCGAAIVWRPMQEDWASPDPLIHTVCLSCLGGGSHEPDGKA